MHKIKVVSGALNNETTVNVNSENILFRIELDHQLAMPQFVYFIVTPANASLVIDGKPYLLNQYGEIAEPLMLQNGTYTYMVSAKDYHDETGTFVIDGAKVDKSVNLKPAHGFLKVSGEGVLNGASVFIDGNLVGQAPLTSAARRRFATGLLPYLPISSSIRRQQSASIGEQASVMAIPFANPSVGMTLTTFATRADRKCISSNA